MLALFAFNNSELVLMFIVVLLLFGGKKIPELARSLGKGVSEFKKGVREIETEVDVQPSPTSSPAAPVQQNQQQPVAAASASPQPFRFDPYTGKPVDEPTPVATAIKPQ